MNGNKIYTVKMTVKEISFLEVISILQALKGEPLTPNRIAKCLNEELCEVKHVLESAAENGILVKVGRKFDWSQAMKFPRKRANGAKKRRRVCR